MVYDGNVLNVLLMQLYDCEQAHRCFPTQISNLSLITFPYL